MNNHINSEIIEIHEDIRPSRESTPLPRYQTVEKVENPAY